MRRRRFLSVSFIILLVAGVAAWRYQSAIIGLGARWYLSHLAAAERADGSLMRRRGAVAGLHRFLLMPAPPDGMVDELFELMTLITQRVASGDMSPSWGAYVYTGYVRDLMRDRPDGRPPRDTAAVRAALEQAEGFYAIRARPDVPGIRLGDVLGAPGDSYTKDEIEQAAREGRDLPLR